MKSRVLVTVIGTLIILFLITGACSIGFVAGRVSNLKGLTPLALNQVIPNQGLSSQTVVTQTQSSTSTESLFAPFWETWNIVHNEYVEQPVDDKSLMRGAIRGMLAALGDQHTSYMDPDQYRRANAPLMQEYEGIGAWVDTNAEFLTIVSPMPGSPAEKAGLKPGDAVIAVDGQDVTGLDGILVQRKVIGPAGTKVRLTIRRDGSPEPLEFEIERAKITIPSVNGKMLSDKIAYIQIFQFALNTRNELRNTLSELQAQNPVGLIIDLRNNGGGFLDTAIEVSSEFIPQGVIVYEQYGNGKRDSFEALGNGLATKIPLVLLINKGTASASEIVAGAIQDYGRGKLVGTTSYGKGSVQDWVKLSGDEGAVRVTVAHWLTPKERQINEIGLKPDVEVPLTEEDIKAQRDPQLDKAVELIKQ